VTAGIVGRYESKLFYDVEALGYCVTRVQPFTTLGLSWNIRPYDAIEGELGARIQSLGTWTGSMPPSFICKIMNIAGTAREQSLAPLFLLGSEHGVQWEKESNHM